MIFRIKKALFKEIEDYVISAEGFFIKVAKLLKGYYLYGSDGVQVAQIIFEKDRATVTVADSASLCVSRDDADAFVIGGAACDEGDASIDKRQSKQSPEYVIYGQPSEYRYDIYEKNAGSKAYLTANVINDLQSPAYYKVRAQSGNILKNLMIALAVDKLINDADARY